MFCFLSRKTVSASKRQPVGEKQRTFTTLLNAGITNKGTGVCDINDQIAIQKYQMKFLKLQIRVWRVSQLKSEW
mgnify:CR=1 FL=1